MHYAGTSWFCNWINKSVPSNALQKSVCDHQGKNHWRNREPSSANTEASGKNVVQETISSDRCYHNPKILTNYLICAVTVAPLLIISKHSIINRIHSDSLVHLVSYILIYEFAEESYFLCVVETSSSLLETPRPQFGLCTSLSLRPPIVDSAVPWACHCRRCSLSCFSSETSFRDYL